MSITMSVSYEKHLVEQIIDNIPLDNLGNLNKVIGDLYCLAIDTISFVAAFYVIYRGFGNYFTKAKEIEAGLKKWILKRFVMEITPNKSGCVLVIPEMLSHFINPYLEKNRNDQPIQIQLFHLPKPPMALLPRPMEQEFPLPMRQEQEEKKDEKDFGGDSEDDNAQIPLSHVVPLALPDEGQTRDQLADKRQIPQAPIQIKRDQRRKRSLEPIIEAQEEDTENDLGIESPRGQRNDADEKDFGGDSEDDNAQIPLSDVIPIALPAERQIRDQLVADKRQIPQASIQIERDQGKRERSLETIIEAQEEDTENDLGIERPRGQRNDADEKDFGGDNDDNNAQILLRQTDPSALPEQEKEQNIRRPTEQERELAEERKQITILSDQLHGEEKKTRAMQFADSQARLTKLTAEEKEQEGYVDRYCTCEGTEEVYGKEQGQNPQCLATQKLVVQKLMEMSSLMSLNLEKEQGQNPQCLATQKLVVQKLMEMSRLINLNLEKEQGQNPQCLEIQKLVAQKLMEMSSLMSLYNLLHSQRQ